MHPDLPFVRIAPGVYRVARDISIAGKTERVEIECRNPAYGLARIEAERQKRAEDARQFIPRRATS